jgi:hypothetical protein
MWKLADERERFRFELEPRHELRVGQHLGRRQRLVRLG